MSLLKKIILTVVLVVLLLFVQSYVFSDSCSLIASSPSLKVIPFGCVGDECNFILLNSSDATSPALETCLQECNNLYSPQNVECAQACVAEYVPSPTDMSLNNDLVFTKSFCQDNTKVNVLLGANLFMLMQNNKTNLKISGIDSLNTNGKNIDIFVNNNDNVGDSTFIFDFNNLIVSSFSKIEFRTKERNSITNYQLGEGCQDYTKNGLKFIFNNIEIKENASLDLNINIPDNKANIVHSNSNNNIRFNKCSLYGGEVTFDGNKIINEGVLNLVIKAQDSQDGKMYIDTGNCFTYPHSQGGTSQSAGHVYFYLNYLNNSGSFYSTIFSGNGGTGGNGSKAQDGCNNDPPGNGGNGGDAGNIFIFLDNILNKNYFDLNLVSGNGGKGGNTGFDGGGIYRKNFAVAGSGGNGGNIYFCKVNWTQENGFSCTNSIFNIINDGVLNINSYLGNGNNGGYKFNHPDRGEAGDGGDGGSLYTDINIDAFINNNYFSFNASSGKKGIKGTSTGGINGEDGFTKNVFIKYLKNYSSNFIITLDSRKSMSGYGQSDIIINKLQTGSYLPSKLYTISSEIIYNNNDCNNCYSDYLVCCPDENCDDQQQKSCIDFFNTCLINCQNTEQSDTGYNTINRKVKIENACYIKQPETTLDYKTEIVYIKSANNLQTFFNPGTNLDLELNAECSICDYYDFESTDVFPTGSANKFSQTYTLFSSKQGTIPANNLKIYYAKNNPAFEKINTLYNPFTKENNLPLYKNKTPITGVLNEKLNLYEYKINLNNLEWYYDTNMDLTGKDIFCYYQNYRVEGSIDGTSFNFPFTPIFKN